ncbi:NnrU family protein [Stappia sp.]|jgi:uncharacterized membrane protein|uniref:NnrU family protein n=1 Tax=Stappia sp. TaxID=1870903 RepID=UPI003D0EC51A
MTLLVLGLVAFLGVHMLPILTSVRTRLRTRLGENGYKGLFTVLSIAGFVLLIYGYGVARSQGPAILYDPPLWMRHVTLLLMVPVFVLLVASNAPAGRIKAATKHPMILSVKIWALAHLLANGDVASVLLFAAFLGWAVLDRISLKRRGNAGGAVSASPSMAGDVVSLVVGLGLYVAFVLYLHEWLIGVSVV